MNESRKGSVQIGVAKVEIMGAMAIRGNMREERTGEGRGRGRRAVRCSRHRR